MPEYLSAAKEAYLWLPLLELKSFKKARKTEIVRKFKYEILDLPIILLVTVRSCPSHTDLQSLSALSVNTGVSNTVLEEL